MPNAVVPYIPSTNQPLAVALMGLSDIIKRHTQTALAQNPDWEEYSETEKHSMILIGALKNINGVDLMAIQLRYTYLAEIERTNALTAHPEHYSTLGEMAAAQGISISELSKIRDLCGIVFPYIQDTLQISVAVLWENIGKTKFFELLSILKVLITGQPSDTNTVNQAVNYLVEDATVTDVAAGMEILEDAQEITAPERQVNRTLINRQVIENLLQNAETLPTAELRQHTRPDRTPAIQTLVITYNGRKVVLSEMDPGQYEMFQRRLSGHMDAQYLDLPENRAERQELLFMRREFRKIYELIE